MQNRKLRSVYVVMILVISALSLGLFPSLSAAPEPQLVEDINLTPGVGSISSNPFLTPFNNTLLFVANDGLVGDELWKAEQTTVSMVKDIAWGPDSLVPFNLKVHNGLLYFTGNDGLGSGEELWISDGTITGTVLLKDINPTLNESSNPSRFAPSGGTLFFQATDGVNGIELWKTDGTITGTLMVKDIYSGSSSSPSQLTDVNGTLFFVATDDLHGEALWKSDGTPGGTVVVKDILPGPGSNEEIQRFQSLGDRLFFRADDGIHGVEPWISDGTITGTVMVKDIYPGLGDSLPNDLAVLNGEVYFRATDGSLGEELWKSDGTESGTAIVKDINPGSGHSNPGGLTTVGQEIYFAASDGITWRELWKSDGTQGGTQLVKDINPTGSSGPSFFTNVNGTVFFRSSDGVYGVELWKTNGSAASTELVKDIYPGSSASNPADFVQVQDLLYFSADDGVHGKELWALELQNLPPTLDAGGPYTGVEGSPINLTGTVTDDDQVIVEWTSSDPDCEFSDPTMLQTSITCTDNDQITVTLQAWDWWSETDSDQSSVAVNNAPPEIISSTLSANPVQVGIAVNVTVLYSDPGQADTHTAVVDWDDGTGGDMIVDPLAHSAVAVHTYANSGLYTIQITVTDDDSASIVDTIELEVTAGGIMPDGEIYLPLIER